MGNLSVLAQLEAMIPYEPEGFQDAVRTLRGSLGRMHLHEDDLKIKAITTSAKTDIVTNAAVKVAMVYVKTNSGATTTGYMQFFNTSTATVQLGTTAPEMVLKLSNAAGVGHPVVFYNSTEATQFGAACSFAATVTSGVNTTALNATNAPTGVIVYATP